MKRLLMLAALICAFSAHLHARAKYTNFCMDGNFTVTIPLFPTSPSVSKYMRSFSACTVTVYLSDGITLATLYSDNAGTPLTNPFTAQSDGMYGFYADNGRYTIKLSGAGISGLITISDQSLFDGGAGLFFASSFGFRCDGTTSAAVNNAALQAAMNAAAGGILIPGTSGTCLVSANFTVPSAGLWIMGPGAQLLAIQTSSGTAGIFTAATGSSFTLTGLALTSSATQTAGSYVSITGPGGSTVNNLSVIRDVKMHGCWICVSLGVVQGIEIDNLQAEVIESRGIVSNNTANGDQETGKIINSQFAEDASKTTAAAIEINAGVPTIMNCHFFSGFQYQIFVNWNTSQTVGGWKITANQFDFPLTAAIHFQRANSGVTGLLGSILINSNQHLATSTFPGKFVDVASDTAAWIFIVRAVGNVVELNNAATTGFNFPGGAGPAGDASYFSGNSIRDTDGLSTGFVCSTAFTQTTIGDNYNFTGFPYVGCPTSNRGSYQLNWAFGALSPGIALLDPITIPNNTSLATRSSTNTRNFLISQDPSDFVRIAQSGQPTRFGNYLIQPNNTFYRSYAADGTTQQRLIGQDGANVLQIAPDSQLVNIPGELDAASIKLTSGSLSTTVTNGTHTATPSTVEQFLQLTINGVSYKIPLYKP